MDQATAIREARIQLRMTQIHLAGAADVSKRTVIRAEQGKSISQENIRSICSVLGLDAAELELVPTVKNISPDHVLANMITAAGERVIWQGAPDSDQWKRVNGVHIWEQLLWVAVILPILSLAGPAWIHFTELALWDQGLGYNHSALAMAFAWSGLLLALCLKFITGMSWHDREADRLDRTLHVVTDKAMYVATRDKGDTPVLGNASRYPIPEDRSLVYAKSRYLLWPPAKVVRIEAPWYNVGRKVDIPGVQDPESLVYLLRNGIPIERQAA